MIKADTPDHVRDRNGRAVNRATWVSAVGLGVFMTIGWWVVIRSQGGGNAPEVVNYHYMLLDGWSVVFVGLLLLIWWQRPRPAVAISIVLAAIAAYGVVSLSLALAPSQFPDNGYWGDQKFRIAMIQHFMTHGTLTDYYFRDLPIFYPPTYYYILALIGKLTGQTAYKMAQVGLELLFVVAPACILFLWRKLLSTTAALLVTVAVVLVDIGGSFMLVAVPHAFLANSLFVPWCLHYLIGLPRREWGNWERWLMGSIIGALIFSTYFYPFIVLGFALIVLGMVDLVRRHRKARMLLKWKWSVALLAGVGVFSAWYWLPNVLAISKFGMDRSRGDWYHATSGGIEFPFTLWSVLGIVGASAILYLVRRRNSIIRALLWMIVAAVGLYGVGSFLGAVDFSLNLTKNREFIWALMTPLIGLALYTVIGKLRRDRYGKVLGVSIVALLLFSSLQGMTRFAHDSYVDKARITEAPDFGLTAVETAQLADKVLLASNEECYAFLPAKAFMNVNEHFAHPASRFALRYDFLAHLTDISDPELFHYALRHNRFDPIDCIFPGREGDSVALYVALSNYPDGLVLKRLTFPAYFLNDTTRYRRVGRSSMYRVLPDSATGMSILLGTNTGEPALVRAKNMAVWARLSQSGGERPVRIDSCLAQCELDPLNPFWIDGRLVLTDAVILDRGDSLLIALSLRKNRPIYNPTRVYLHIYDQAEPDKLLNFDFDPSIDLAKWDVGGVVTLSRVLSKFESGFGYVTGVFDDEGPTGEPFDSHYHPLSANSLSR